MTQNIRAIKGQIADFSRQANITSVSTIRTQLAKEIERLEHQLGEYSKAVCGFGTFGLAYRDILEKAAKICAGGEDVLPNEKLQPLFLGRTLNDLAAIEGAIKATAELWERARPNTNPWRLRSGDVSVDQIARDSVQRALSAISTADRAHSNFVAQSGKGFVIAGDPRGFHARGTHWLEQIKSAMEPHLFDACSLWIGRLAKNGRSPLETALAEIQPVIERFASISRTHYD